MAFVLTPHFAPAYQAPQCSPFGFCAPVSRPAYSYRVSRPQPRRPQYSSFNHFFSQVDNLLSEIDREAQRQAQLEARAEAQREAHRQRQQRKRALRATFAVSQNEQGWRIDGDIQGFEQENISIEVTDSHTLKISGNTQWQSEEAQTETHQLEAEATPEHSNEVQASSSDGVTLNEPEAEAVSETETDTVRSATPDSDTGSHKSYQATVEDDFEDLGAEASSLISSLSVPSTPSTSAAPAEPERKEKAVDVSTTTQTTVAPQPQPEVPAQRQQQSQEEERIHGTFERTFRFPERIDATCVSASFKEGVLSINVPKAQVPQIRRIAIS